VGETEGIRAPALGRWDGSPFNFIPQGGGDHQTGHRCPGEWIALALMKQAADFLARGMRYDVPKQDLRPDWSRLPQYRQAGL
jgi:fatty-acid peroxygenase